MASARPMNRRTLLGAVGSMVVGGVARAAIRPPASVSRRLKLFNAHTRETFDGPYRGSDGVIASAAADLSEFLRDHHSGVAVSMDMGVIDFLWDVLNAVGTGSATILSAYRTPVTNAMLARTTFGVAEHSEHMFGRAIDFTIGHALAEGAVAARAMRRGGVGWYPRSKFIHVDTGPVRNWSLGNTDLQNLLINPADAHEPHLRSASMTGPARGQAPHAAKAESIQPSQYAPDSVGDELIRPSAYSSVGTKDGLIRPSQYGGRR